MISLFLTGLANTFIHYTLHFNTDVDKFVFMFLLIDLLIAATACLIRELDRSFHIMLKICDQFNLHLKKRDVIITSTRKGFVFEKVKASYYCIMYFRMLGILKEVERAQNDLISFGVSELIAKDDQKLTMFLKDLAEGKYLTGVNEKERKFIFVKKELLEEDEEDNS